MRIADLLLEDRVDFLRGRYVPLIRQRAGSLQIAADIRRQIALLPGPAPEQQIFNWLLSRDPTPNRQYLGWILACAIDRGVPFEDIEYLPETLAKYHERKRTNTLPAAARDINRIKTPSQLDVLLRDVGGAEAVASAEEQSQARQESQVLLDDDAWLVVIPQTRYAAQFYGRGTEWCTAYGDPKGLHPRRGCQFNEYNNRGPLIITINKTNPTERYQFHAPSHQYMDRSDAGIGINGFLKLAQRHPALISALLPYLPVVGIFGDESQQLAAVRERGGAIRYIKNPTEAVQLAAVQQNGGAIRYIKNPSEAVKWAAVRQNGGAIQYIANPSEALRLAAVRQDGHAIEYIPNPTEDIQLAAVRQNGYAIQYIKDPSEALEWAAVRQDCNVIRLIKDPSEALKLAAVRQNGYAIRFIETPSEAVQLAAIKQDGGSIGYIKNPSEAVQLAVIKQDGGAIRYIENPSEAVIKLAYQRGFNRYGKPIPSPR